MTRTATQPVIISGMFRSGTTLLWRFMAADPAFTRSLVEPLHATLPREVEQWPHYGDYKNHPELLEKWSQDFSWKHLALGARDEYPELKAYLDEVLKAGTLAKFTRLNLRLSWVKKHYPGVPIVNIVRDPRAVCLSFLKHNQVPLTSAAIDWRAYNAEMYFQILSRYPAWSGYLSRLQGSLPFIKVLAVYNIVVGCAIAGLQEPGNSPCITIRYEDLVQSPERELQRIYQLWQATPPGEVLEETRRGKKDRITRKWQAPVSDAWIHEWRKVLPGNVWRNAIAQAGLEPLMNHLGYPLD